MHFRLEKIKSELIIIQSLRSPIGLTPSVLPLWRERVDMWIIEIPAQRVEAGAENDYIKQIVFQFKNRFIKIQFSGNLKFFH